MSFTEDTFPHFARRRDIPISLKQAGSVGRGLSDDTAALQRFLDYTGDFYLPPGVYNFSHLDLYANTRLVCAPGARLVLIPGSSHAIGADGDNIHIDGLDLECNGQVSGHGVRWNHGVDLSLNRFIIRNTQAYGFAGAESDNTRVARLHISNGYILNAGNDGCDFKDKLGQNEGNSIRDVVSVNPGVIATDSPAFDFRGRSWTCSNLHALGVRTLNYGIRFRQADAGVTGLYGAEGSSLVGFRVQGDPASRPTIGVVVSGDFCTVMGGSILNAVNGVQMFGVHNRCIGVSTESEFGEGQAFWSPSGSHHTYMGCHGINHLDGYRMAGDSHHISGGVLENMQRWGIRLSDAPTNLRVDPRPRMINNVSSQYSDGAGIVAAAAATQIHTHKYTTVLNGNAVITSLVGFYRGLTHKLRNEGGTWTLQHNAGVRLAGGVDFVTTDNDVIELFMDEDGIIYETGRSVNG